MKERGGIAVYILFALVISIVIFSLGTKQTSRIIPSSQEIITVEEKPLETEIEKVAITNDVIEKRDTEVIPAEKRDTEVIPAEKTPPSEKPITVTEKTFAEKIILSLESIQKIKELVGEIIDIQQEEIPTIDTSAPIVNPTFPPDNDGNLERSGILYYTNLEREKEGLTSLKENVLLNEAALAKTKHMFDDQYFEHVAPTGEDVSYWVDNTGYVYISIGENLAHGEYLSEEKMVQDWMDSPGHRANIMKGSFEEIGIAVKRDHYEGRLTWIGVQIFAVPQTACPKINEGLLLSIESFRLLVEEVGKTITSLHSTVSSLPQPTTQKEYEDYTVLVEQYNSLVDEEKDLSEQLNVLVKKYNDQVNAYNACIATK